MKKAAVLIFLIIVSYFVAVKRDEMTVPNKAIQLSQLEDMFSNIREKTDWDMNGPMVWGYFFTHHDPSKLELAKEALISKGYKFVGINRSDKDNANEPDVFWLHVEKIEQHTPSSLDKRNDEFYIFAHNFGLDTYDGMDVGPVPQ